MMPAHDEQPEQAMHSPESAPSLLPQDEARERHHERLRRWRLLLGSPAGAGSGGEGESANGSGIALSSEDQAMDRAMGMLYDGERSAGREASAPFVARWLGDIRTYFPKSVVQVMQKDALERLHLKQMLLQPELLEAMEPDVELIASLIALNRVIPAETRETARQVVRQVTRELERRLRRRTEQAVRGSLNRAQRNNRRPRYAEIDWHKTIRANLKHYQPEYRTIIPERRYGYGRKQQKLRDIILCIDQSGSMASSVVYASVFGAVLASLKSVSTQMIVFDTSVVDLTHDLHDPVDLLFGVQLGGGTDINRALAYCQSRIRRPNETILILISDLYEGGNPPEMLQRAAAIVAGGTRMVALLSLSDRGAPAYDHHHAEAMAAMGIPAFACTPDLFPDLLAAAIEKRDFHLPEG